MKKLILMISLFCTVTAYNANAQGVERDVDVFPEQVSIDHNDAVKKFSKDYVSSANFYGSSMHALGSALLQANQLAIINQIGNQNVAGISQSGSKNYAVINIVGDRNDVGIQQDGYMNIANMNVFGDDNELNLMQQGSWNVFSRTFMTNNAQGQFSQIGTGLNLDIQGVNGIPLRIQQTGQGMGMTIQNN